MDIKKISLSLGLIIGSSTLINIVIGFFVPRYELFDIFEELNQKIDIIEKRLPLLASKKDTYYEINRVELNMMELHLLSREENTCERQHDELSQYLICIEEVKYRTSLRYFEINK